MLARKTSEEGLHYILRYGVATIAQSMSLEHGADINATDEEGNTPLEIAICMDHDLMVRDLLDDGADLRRQHWIFPSTFSRGGRYPDRGMNEIAAHCSQTSPSLIITSIVT